MKIVIDMNLSPQWVDYLWTAGWETVHWSRIGDARAKDEVILSWAADNGYVLLTHDLDFGAILAATKAKTPSVVQVRTEDVLPDPLGPLLVRVLKENAPALESGALVVVEESRSRVRILPIR